jgi:purine-binding chemotaxis protein CheW
LAGPFCFHNPSELGDYPRDSVTNSSLFLLFSLDGLRLALRGEDVRMITRAVQVTSLQQGLDDVLGIINVHGQIVPVLNLRKKLGLQSREVDSDDFLILAESSHRPVGLIVTDIEDVYEVSAQTALSNEELFRGDKKIQLLRIDEKIVMVQELHEFLSAEQKILLDQALEGLAQ